MVAKHVRDARLLDTAAGMHNIKTWEIVVKEVKGRGLLKEALLTKSRDGHTVLTAAVESKDAAMVAKVLECVHDTLSNEEAKSLLLSGSVRGATLPQCLARRRGAEIWVILLDAWKKYGALDEALGMKSCRGRTVLANAVEIEDLNVLAKALEYMRMTLRSPQQTVKEFEDELLGTFRGLEQIRTERYDYPFMRRGRHQNAKVLSCLVQHSLRPTADDLALLSPT
ncbi:unnamed protein product, partial [Ectocarpus sp. 4 AP-2014]